MVDKLLEELTVFLTAPQTLETAKLILMVFGGSILASILFRLIFGKRSTLSKSVTALLSTFIIYCIVTILLYHGEEIQKYLFDLPFYVFQNNTITIQPIVTIDEEFCFQLLRLVVLDFLSGLVDELLPEGKKLIPWFLLRCLSIVLSIVMFWCFNWMVAAFLPDTFRAYAAFILLILLGLLLAVTVFKWLITLLLGIVGGPVISGIYAFFVSHIVGRQLTKAALASGSFMGLIYLLDTYNMNSFSVSAQAYTLLIPIVILLMLAWYLICKFF